MPLDQLTKPRTKTKALKIPPMTVEEIAAGAPPEIVRITRPKLVTTNIQIVGIAPYVQHAFSEKIRKKMEETQRAGQQGRSKRTREPKDFEAIYEAAKHISEDGWVGIPAPAFRNAC